MRDYKKYAEEAKKKITDRQSLTVPELMKMYEQIQSGNANLTMDVLVDAFLFGYEVGYRSGKKSASSEEKA